MSGLLGPNGLPISTHKKKNPIPALGPAYGRWSGEDVRYNQMPGGGILQFNLDALTLADFRAMRYNPQINSSLCLLTFMLHQIDWTIKCKDKRVAAGVDDLLRPLWTRLVRGLSQAFWAGFSPIVLEYDNDVPNKQITIGKFKDLIPEDCRPRWQRIYGTAPAITGITSQGTIDAMPGTLYDSDFGITLEAYDGVGGTGGLYSTVPPVFREFNGILQYGASAIPVENSLWYPLLMENGNYYGRKLLKAAFAPWYFSTLVHLFANRYYERFGEPVPIGRAPFDDNFIQDDGTTITGKQAMESILMQLRNRSVVVLPNDVQPFMHVAQRGTGQTSRAMYEYDITYLESQMRGADFERYMTRLDEEMSLSLFTPLLMLKTGDVGSHNLGVQHTQCVAPETPILCADLVWRRADECLPGQEIIAFDDKAAPGQGRGVDARKYRMGFIVKNIPGSKPSMRLTTDIGIPVTASVDHPWLVWRNRDGSTGYRTKGLVWVETRDLVVGDKIAHLARPWTQPSSPSDGWLAGMFDGEGSLVENKSNHGFLGRAWELTISQNEGPLLDHLDDLLSDRGFDFTQSAPTPTGYGSGKCRKLRINGGFLEQLRLVGTIRPLRFLEKVEQMFEERGLRQNQSYQLATVTSIEDIGENPVASIQTSTGTFITAGYLSHNTWLWMLNAISGDMKEYIDRFVIQKLVDYNYSASTPRCEWVPGKLGKENTETLRAIITALITAGAASVDPDELGQALGMSIKEVQTVTRDSDPHAPGAMAVPEPEPLGNPSATQQPGNPSVPGRDALPRSGDNKGTGKPKGVGEPRATGRQVSARIKQQVEKAWRERRFDGSLKLSLGYRKRMIESFHAEGLASDVAEATTNELYDKIDRWAADVVELGMGEFSGPSDFMSLFDRNLDNLLEDIQA